jgi:hypothetical protein
VIISNLVWYMIFGDMNCVVLKGNSLEIQKVWLDATWASSKADLLTSFLTCGVYFIFKSQ